MAEVNVNSAHTHSGWPFDSPSSVLDPTGTGKCDMGHSRCVFLTFSYKQRATLSARLGYGRIASSGEVNINAAHSHSQYVGSTYVSGDDIPGVGACAQHQNCYFPWNEKNYYSTVVSDVSSSYQQTSGEVNINVSHAHTYKRYEAIDNTPYSFSSCSAGHSYCQAVSYFSVPYRLSSGYTTATSGTELVA